jgi:hypothetical protein
LNEGRTPAPNCRAVRLTFCRTTPSRFWEANSAVELVNDVIFGHWFKPTDRIEAIEHDVVVDRERVGYRFRVTNEDSTFIVEQQAYLSVRDDEVTWLRIMCAGYQPVGQSTA